MNLIDLTTDLKVAWGVVMGTGATAAADLMEMAPEWAPLLACVLTSVLIVTHIIKGFRDSKKHKVDLAIAELRLGRLMAEDTEID